MSDLLNLAHAVVDQNKVSYALIAACCVRELIILNVFQGSLVNPFLRRLCVFCEIHDHPEVLNFRLDET